MDAQKRLIVDQMTIARDRQMREAGLGDWVGKTNLQNAQRYAAAGWTADEAETCFAFRHALLDFCDADEWLRWHRLGFIPDEARLWAKAQHSPEDAAARRALGYAPRLRQPKPLRTR